MTEIRASRSPTGWLRGPVPNLGVEGHGASRRYILDGQRLSNDDEIEISLRGNSGWIPARVEGLPHELGVVFRADDGTVLHTSLSPGIRLRWP